MTATGLRFDQQEDRETIVVAVTIVSVVLATAFWVLRIGLYNPAAPVLRSLGLALFCCAAPYWIAKWLSRKRYAWFVSQSFLTIACVAALAVIGLLGGGTAASLLIGLAGAALSLVTIFSWLARGPFRSTAVFLAGSLAFAGWAAGVVWTSRYKLPLYWETLSLNANVHHDPLYYVAMGNMMQVYGVPSTGLDGIPYIHYHYGSPWLFTQLSSLIGVHLLSFYSMGYAVILIPLFLAAILLLMVEVRRDSPPVVPLRSNAWAWLIFAAATIGVLPESALFGMAVWNAHVLISESYLAGLPIFLCGLATAVVFWRTRGARTVTSLPFLLVFLPALVAALGYLKMSLMALFLALALYAGVRLRLLRSAPTIVSAVLMVGVAAATYSMVALAEHNRGISPLDFMRYHTAEGWAQFFPLVHLAWCWVYAGARLWEERATKLGDVAAAIRSGKLLDVELLLLLALVGFLPGEILSIHGGSAIYFSDVQRWVALPLLMARAAVWVARWRASRRSNETPGEARRGLRALPLHVILAVILIAPFAVTLALNAIKPPVRLVRQNLITRTTLVANADRSKTSRAAAGQETLVGVRHLFNPVLLESGLERGRYYALVSALRDIEELPPSVRNNVALFIPQSYALYWDMFSADKRCTYVSLVAPAVAGVALIDGMPPYGCEVTEQYNMRAYQPRLRPQSAEDLTSASICRKARSKGFRRVIVLAPDAAGAPQRRSLDCVA